MAFTLQAIRGSTTVTLTNGAPFRLLEARGLSGAPIRRVTTRGPAQDGDTDKDYRLGPREMELDIGFLATTDAILDGYRDTLMGVFKPLTSTPVNLRATRDDAAVRQVDCYAIDEIKIDLLPEHRPGHYHRATVRLRAADVPFYNPTPGTVTVTGTAGLSPTWYLAGGVIGSANVLMVGTAPAQGEAWSYAGTLGTGDPWTLAFRSTYEAQGSLNHYAFHVDNTGADIGIVATGTAENPPAPFPYGVASSTANVYGFTGSGEFMQAGTHNYFWIRVPSQFYGGGHISYSDLFHRGGVGYVTAPGNLGFSISGTPRRWRSDSTNTAASRWGGTIPLYALYNVALSQGQLAALNSYMSSEIGGSVSQLAAVPYSGDLDEFPVIQIRGPITSPTVTNTTTGEILSFGTITIGAGTTYVIDTRYGIKTVLQGATNKRGELSADSDLGTWHLAPNPVAPGGTNTIQVTGTDVGTATQINVIYYNRYLSF